MAREKKKIISLLGLPASGKGTQSNVLANRFDIPLVGMGDLIREEIEENKNPNIKEIKKNYQDGVLQSDELISELIKKKLRKIEKNGVVFDNYPFSLYQAEKLFNFVDEDVGWDKPTLIIIDIGAKTSFERIKRRRICPKCDRIYHNAEIFCTHCGTKLIRRTDDNDRTLKNRIKQYIPRMAEMESFYAKKGRVLKINGEPSIEIVAKSLEEQKI